jgi:hypothetical protein
MMPCNIAVFEGYVHFDALVTMNAVEEGSTDIPAMEKANRQAFYLHYDLEDC